MTLTDYIKAERGNGRRLADKLGISLSMLSQIAADATSTHPLRCVAVEQATDGAVRRWELRPGDWHRIWPELIGADGAPEVEHA